MSRIGKKPVAVPAGVSAAIARSRLTVKGPKGELFREIPPRISVTVGPGEITVSRSGDSRLDRSLHGLTRTLISNMVKGVTEGYRRVLEINGVGFRAAVSGQAINLSLGFSHPVSFPLPPGVKAEVEKNTVITLSGIDKQVLGQAAANLRALKPPEPYKGKGIKFAEEVVRRKEGKTGKK
ncbi:MAG: 50S ribosomal protein L6 [Nitrospirae bacterium RBG_16_64_22]|nr:MAG: 50S ribosomal protein L6 [Nitrospirae bacterium RBG_16_64_22]